MIDKIAQMVGIEGFEFEQGLGDELHLVAALVEDALGGGVGVIDETLDLGVDHAGGFLGVVAGFGHVAGEEDG